MQKTTDQQRTHFYNDPPQAGALYSVYGNQIDSTRDANIRKDSRNARKSLRLACWKARELYVDIILVK